MGTLNTLLAKGKQRTLKFNYTEQPTNNPIIPREVLFSDPKQVALRISPDGKCLSYLAPDNGVLNIWLAEVANLKKAKVLTKDKIRGIRTYSWTYDNKHILYMQDTGGDENWQLFSINIDSGEIKNLSKAKAKTNIIALSDNHPAEILIGLNDRNPKWHDVYKVNLTTGEKQLILENNKYADFIADNDLKLRFGTEFKKDGSYTVYSLDNNKIVLEVPIEDIESTSIIGFNKTNDEIFLVDSRQSDTTTLTSLNLTTNKTTIIGNSELADIESILFDPIDKKVLAFTTNYLRPKWHKVSQDISFDLKYLASVQSGDFHIVSKTLDNKIWIVAYANDDSATKYYFYDRTTKAAKYLLSTNPDLDNLPLNSMQPLIIKSRDNLNLVSYLTMPKGTDANSKSEVPLVLYVHGGPIDRDSWGFDKVHQWLSNRGYAVLSVNYRGSTGFGKKFIMASYGQWSKKMHDDLLDAVNWAVAKKITSKDKVIIMGGSYGGYATLVGLTMTPEVFAAGVDIVGMSNLETDLATLPEYWMPFYENQLKRIGGDPRTPEGRKFLQECSPITYVNNITKPLLIAHGANDPRVKQAESEQIVKKMGDLNIPVTYVLFPDEGHGFARPPNRLAFFAVTEAFLAKLFGLKHEPIHTHELAESSLEIKEGEEFIINNKTNYKSKAKKPA